jgi:hypothetical protein
MPKFTWRPDAIEARQFETNNDDGRNLDELVAWVRSYGDRARHDGTSLFIAKRVAGEGEHRAEVGDWIVLGDRNHFYPITRATFEANYAPLPDEVTETVKAATEQPVSTPEVVKALEIGVSRDTAITAAQFCSPAVGGERYASLFLSWVMSGGGDVKMESSSGSYSLRVATLHGLVDLNQDDWVVRLGAGRYVVHPPANFARFYAVAQ